MTKTQLLQALAEALNVINDIQCTTELPLDQVNSIENLLRMIPAQAIEASDYRNNGSISPRHLAGIR